MSSSAPLRLWSAPAVRALVGVTTLGFTSFALTYAALPYWAVARGSSTAAAGVVTGAMLAATVASQFTVPAATARWGVRRVFGAGLLALGVPAPLYLIDDHLWWLLVASLVRGVGFAVLTVLGATLTAHVAPPDRHGEAIGIYGLAIAAPSLAAVPAGAALATSGHFAVVAIAAAVPVLALPLIRWLPNTQPASAEPAAVAAHALAGRRRARRATVVPGILLLVVTVVASGFITYLPIERPSGAVATAGLFALGATAAVTRWRVGRLADRAGTSRLLPAGLVVAAVGALVAALSLHGHGPAADVAIVAGCAIGGAGYGAVQNLTLMTSFARAGAGYAPTASATWNAAFDSGSGIGAAGVGGLHATGLSLPTALAAAAMLIVIALPLARR